MKYLLLEGAEAKMLLTLSYVTIAVCGASFVLTPRFNSNKVERSAELVRSLVLIAAVSGLYIAVGYVTALRAFIVIGVSVIVGAAGITVVTIVRYLIQGSWKRYASTNDT